MNEKLYRFLGNIDFYNINGTKIIPGDITSMLNYLNIITGDKESLGELDSDGNLEISIEQLGNVIAYCFVNSNKFLYELKDYKIARLFCILGITLDINNKFDKCDNFLYRIAEACKNLGDINNAKIAINFALDFSDQEYKEVLYDKIINLKEILKQSSINSIETKSNIVNEYFDKIGGFSNFNKTIFSLLPLKDRVDILKIEYKIRPSADTIDRLILSLAKSKNIEETEYYIDIGISIGFLAKECKYNDYYKSWLKDGPSVVIDYKKSLELLKDYKNKESYKGYVQQIELLINYINFKASNDYIPGNSGSNLVLKIIVTILIIAALLYISNLIW